MVVPSLKVSIQFHEEKHNAHHKLDLLMKVNDQPVQNLEHLLHP